MTALRKEIFVNMSSARKTEKLVLLGIFSAMAFVLYLLEFPVLPSLGHLKLDLSDFPALIGSVFFGPAFGVIIELVKNVLELIFKGVGTQMGFGNIMNFVVGCSYIVPFSLIFRKYAFGKNVDGKRRATFAVVGGIVGIISIIVSGIASNYFIDPLFFKYFLGIELTNDALWGAIWGATVLNVIKGVMLAVAGYPLMLALSKYAGRVFKLTHK